MSTLISRLSPTLPRGSPAQVQPSIEEILACIADAVISTDVDGTIVLFNPAAEKTFGYAAKEVIGTSVHRLLPARFRGEHHAHLQDFSKAPENVARAMASERKVLGRRSDGSEFAAEAMLSCREIDHSTLLTVIVRDVSQRLALEEERELLAAEMAHRFGNVMAMVQAVIALTAKSASSVEQFRSELDGRIRA
ncbi:MAG: PAS domain S-box protein, partial [Oxalobacteraceae bacterium]